MLDNACRALEKVLDVEIPVKYPIQTCIVDINDTYITDIDEPGGRHSLHQLTSLYLRLIEF